MIDPYDILGIARQSDDERIKAAYRQRAKVMHPDSGGSSGAFDNLQKAYELLMDPVRRKGFDETGYDLQYADATDIQGLLVIEKLVNDIVLDEREPGTFDPLERMRAKLNDDIRKARFQMREMEGHRARVENHLERLGKRPGSDVLGYMLRARIGAIATAIAETESRIEAAKRAHDMLDGYTYMTTARDNGGMVPAGDSLPAFTPHGRE